jgi:hypothetical protein
MHNRYGSDAIQEPALKILGNVVMVGEVQKQYIIDLSSLSVLPQLLNSPNKDIRDDARWMPVNIAGNTSQIQAVIEPCLPATRRPSRCPK